MLEKTFVDQEMLKWKGEIPVEYLYTAGMAGEQFFRMLKEKGRLIGTVCTKCRVAYLPPRMFCERCFSSLKRWKPVPRQGVIFTYTVNHVDIDNNNLSSPIVIALVKFKGFHGGIIHKIAEISPEEVNIGMIVAPVVEDAKKRTGTINDIKYFRPT